MKLNSNFLFVILRTDILMLSIERHILFLTSYIYHYTNKFYLYEKIHIKRELFVCLYDNML